MAVIQISIRFFWINCPDYIPYHWTSSNIFADQIPITTMEIHPNTNQNTWKIHPNTQNSQLHNFFQDTSRLGVWYSICPLCCVCNCFFSPGFWSARTFRARNWKMLSTWERGRNSRSTVARRGSTCPHLPTYPRNTPPEIAGLMAVLHRVSSYFNQESPDLSFIWKVKFLISLDLLCIQRPKADPR